MSADRTLGALVCGLAVCSSGVALAADEDVPDPDFLEYLGMWEESDEDWLILDESVAVEKEEQSDPVPEGTVSPEKDHER